MAVWNVTLPVIANLEADTAKEAIDRLYAALDGAGFTVYSDGTTEHYDLAPFEAEEGTEAETLPGEGLRGRSR